MSHGVKNSHLTRRMQGGDTGVKGRRSREGAGLGAQIIADHVQGNPPKEAVKKLEGFWNKLSHQWFGTNQKSFPYNMGKWDNKTKGSMLTVPRTMREKPRQPPPDTEPMHDDHSISISSLAQPSPQGPPRYKKADGNRMTYAEALHLHDWNDRKNRN